MKKFYTFALLALAICSAVSAQSVGEAALKDGGTMKYTQLWANGPKFARFNLGTDIMSYTCAKAYNTNNIGWFFSWGNNTPMHCEYYAESTACQLIGDADPTIHYWGKNWRTPNIDELQGLCDDSKVSWEWCDGETTQYLPGCRLAGYKVSGLDEYFDHNIFLPAAGMAVSNALTTQGIYGWYWSMDQTSGYNAGGIYFFDGGNINAMGSFMGYGYNIRPVLNEDEYKGHALSYRVHYILDSDSPFIGGEISVTSKTGAEIPTPIYVTDNAPITVTMTPEGTNKLATFTINGEDRSSEVTKSGSKYVWNGTLDQDMNIECSYATSTGVKFSWTSGKGGTIKASYDYMVGGQSAVRTDLINNQVLDNGTTVYLTITPDFGYSVDEVLVNGMEPESTSSIVLTEDSELEVTFKENETTGEERFINGNNMEIVDHSYYTTGGQCYGWWQLLAKTGSTGDYILNLASTYGYTSPIGHWTLSQMDSMKDWGYSYIINRSNNKIYMSSLSLDVAQIAPFTFTFKGEAYDEDGNHYTIDLQAVDYDDKVEGYEENDPEPIMSVDGLKADYTSATQNGKYLNNGHIIILNNNHTYYLDGRKK